MEAIEFMLDDKLKLYINFIFSPLYFDLARLLKSFGISRYFISNGINLGFKIHIQMDLRLVKQCCMLVNILFFYRRY